LGQRAIPSRAIVGPHPRCVVIFQLLRRYRETIAEENKASYFPLLDRISSGAFSGKTSDKELYDEFLRVANAEGFLTDPVELSSFNLALSIHAAAPRIEAHYHYYDNNLVPQMGEHFDPACKVWVLWGSKQICEWDGDFNDMIAGQEHLPNDHRKLQFDRALETGDNKPAAILYADIEAPEFRAHHERLERYAKEGHISYRLRYRPPVEPTDRPVMLSGYGVSLVLKKTDYMVMDDRDVEGDAGKDKAATEGVERSTQQQPLGALEDMESHDIKPLQKEDLAELGYKAATFIMGSQDPFETLQRLVQDFPKHAASISATDVNPNVTEELRSNWDMFFGAGKNILWINGLRMEESQINVFALLEHLRRERRYIHGFQRLGLDASETIQLLSHSILAGAKDDEKVQRFDYRDDLEGGNVIVWLNDLEKDNRYKDWNSSPMMLLRRVFPGQLHPIRKNVHNLVIPVDFTSKEDLALISQNLQMFVQRKIAIRFGLVPLTKTQDAADQTKVVYHLLDAYGLKTALKYIEAILDKGDFSEPKQQIFDSIRGGSQLREGHSALSLEEVLSDKSLDERIEKTNEWSNRMGANSPVPPVFINGQPIPKNEDWTSAMSEKLQADVMVAARYVYENQPTEDTDFAAVMLEGAATRRNPHIFPETEKEIRLIDIAEMMENNKDIFSKLPKIDSDRPDNTSTTSLWVIGDFDEEDGYDLIVAAADLQRDEAGVNLILINNPQVDTEKPTVSTMLYQLQQLGILNSDALRRIMMELNPKQGLIDLPTVEAAAQSIAGEVKAEGWSLPDHIEAGKFWRQCQALLQKAGITPGQKAIIVNGRVCPLESPS
jgi:UDP-glucose:glycoprotein glucosyltransferase